MSFEDIDFSDYESIPVRKARESLSEVMTTVAEAKQRILLTKHGKPVVACVPLNDLSTLVQHDFSELNVFAAAQRTDTNIAKPGSTTKELRGTLAVESETKIDETSQYEQLSTQFATLSNQVHEMMLKFDRLYETQQQTMQTNQPITSSLPTSKPVVWIKDPLMNEVNVFKSVEFREGELHHYDSGQTVSVDLKAWNNPISSYQPTTRTDEK
ncbi:MAG: prevent-host-death family protein [Phenylobacterium sp.]|jgi:prevent-host-death family protein